MRVPEVRRKWGKNRREEGRAVQDRVSEENEQLDKKKEEKSWQFQLILSICELLRAGCWQAIMRRAANSKCNGTFRNVEQKMKKKNRKGAPNEWMNEWMKARKTAKKAADSASTAGDHL